MTAWPEGVGRATFETIDSTNAEAQRRALAGATSPIWIQSDRQEQGRGRRGRPWSSDAGNFAATLLMFPEGGPAEAALRSFVAALALRDALVEITDHEELFSLKWPNDVLLRGRKLAGILLESGNASGRMYLCIGIGVNLSHVPSAQMLEPRALPPVCLKNATGLIFSPSDLLETLARHFAKWERIFTEQGFGPIRTAWLSHAAHLGQPVTARLPEREVVGTFETLDETGAIVLQTPEGKKVFPAAEIHFGTEA